MPQSAMISKPKTPVNPTTNNSSPKVNMNTSQSSPSAVAQNNFKRGSTSKKKELSKSQEDFKILTKEKKQFLRGSTLPKKKTGQLLNV